MDKTQVEYRRKRVQRIKKMIIVLCITLLVLPTILTVFLMIKVHALESQIEKLAQKSVQQTKEVQGETTVSGASPSAIIEETKKPSADTPTEVTKESASKVYLTFDDGPGIQTEKILDVLKKENVKATFFVLGKEDEYSKKIYKRIVKEGHTLGMHSYSHLYEEIYSSKEKFKEDVEKEYQLLHSITGKYPRFYRFPGGSRTDMMEIPFSELTAVLDQFSLSYVDWNIISLDAVNAKASKEEITRGIMEAVQEYDTSIVLMYDSAERTMTAKTLPSLIKQLKEKNYELLPIDEDTVPIRHNQ